MFIFLWIFIQVIAEVLPISSSGHAFLLQKIWACLSSPISDHYPWQTIDFVLHVPTFIVLLIFFFKRWWKMVFNKPISFSVFWERDSWLKIVKVGSFLATTSTITFLFWWKRYYGYFALPLAVGFFCTAVAVWSLKYVPKGGKCTWQIRDAVVLGFMQGASMNAGFSRFAFTLITGRLLGYNPRTALAVSFLLEAPLLFGASIKGLYDLYQTPEMFMQYFAIHGLFVIVIATILSYFVLFLVDRMLEKGRLHYIAGYMIVPIVISLVFERCS